MPLDGVWRPWASWTKCSKLCGGGVQYRERKCDNPAVNSKLNYCPGVDKEERLCNNQTCPCDGDFGNWGPWTPCTASCGVGNKRRFRFCVNPPPSNGGRDCEQPNYETASCYQPFQCPQDGEWTLWSMWTPCPAFCGSKGIRQRWRTCQTSQPTQYNPAYPSGHLRGTNCQGKSHELEICEPNYCEALASLQPVYVCLSPKPIIDGSLVVTGSGSEETGYESGSRVSYQCDENLPGVVLELVGPSHQTCQQDGSWSGVDPVCIPSGELTADRFKRNVPLLVDFKPAKDSIDYASPYSPS
ncbi:mucin-like protein [Corticium candelabrum]|uniref:mucin-like protein n=1 Tax=Corticium candelabrum TaxID=121492 RepID=UPI002E25CFC0|nr:mucin-like protein [Corticium candelabrum]